MKLLCVGGQGLSGMHEPCRSGELAFIQGVEFEGSHTLFGGSALDIAFVPGEKRQRNDKASHERVVPGGTFVACGQRRVREAACFLQL